MNNADIALQFLADAKEDLETAYRYLRSNEKPTRAILRIVIEGLEKSTKAVWLGLYSDFIEPVAKHLNAKGCLKNEFDYLSKLLFEEAKEAEKLGHIASLKVLNTIIDVTYLIACHKECRFTLEDFAEISRYMAQVWTSSELEQKFKEFLGAKASELRAVAERYGRENVIKDLTEVQNNLAQVLYSALKPSLEEVYNSALKQVDCKHFREAGKLLRRIIKIVEKGKKKKARRRLSESCTKITKEKIEINVTTVQNMLESINSFRNAILRRAEEEFRVVLDTVKRENEILRALFEAAMIDKLLLEEGLKIVIHIVNRRVASMFVLLAISALHATLYPCYFPSRYSQEGKVPPQLLDRTLMTRITELALNVGMTIERILKET